MPALTTSKEKPDSFTPRPVGVDQARIVWATAPRDSELDRWRELYDLAVPRPRPVPDGER